MACGVIPPDLQKLLEDYDVHTQVHGNSQEAPLLWNLHLQTPQVMVHLFAGGYGGWTSALRYFQPKIYPKVRTVSVELDRKLAFQHALSHKESFFPTDAKLPPGLLDKIPGNLMVCADIASPGWQVIINGASSTLWTLSPPCQPWSSAGREQGLEDVRAQSLPKVFAVARFHQPPLLLFENVKGFRQHSQYPLFGQLLSWAGYQIFYENIVELAEICPIRRPRYLAILVRRDISWDALPSWQPWRDFTFSTPLNFGCWSPTQANEVEDYFPSEATKNFYMSAELCPTRGEQPISTHRVFQTRVPGLNVKQPVLMAKYGEQHLLDINLLLDKGLHGFFCPDQMTFRWWKPVELALMHLQPQDLLLFRPREHAWHSLGNMIATPHAALLLLNAWNLQSDPADHIDVHFAISKMLQDRRTLSASRI